MDRRKLVQILGASAMAASAQTALRFFNPAEAATLDRLAEIIIPADGPSPGAHEAGAIRYIDLVVRYSDTAQQQFWRRGLTAVESEARTRFDRGFTSLSAAQQDQVVAAMAENEGRRQDEMGRFFAVLKRLVVEAYHYSAVHWKRNVGREMNLSLTEFPGCTHEHS
ncbi:MAG TPA: gluconate 2-dehydrogenase subunit 3 family protein [Bryobacteraceae bacterium]|nr:gluconate 2-dehydrogenase subunit 3 family protein [Bryobacteraceae bacterium]